MEASGSCCVLCGPFVLFFQIYFHLFSSSLCWFASLVGCRRVDRQMIKLITSFINVTSLSFCLEEIIFCSSSFVSFYSFIIHYIHTGSLLKVASSNVPLFYYKCIRIDSNLSGPIGKQVHHCAIKYQISI